MLRKGPVEHKTVIPCFQCHGRFLRHLRLQMLHFLRRQIRRVGHDQVQLPFRQALPVGEQVPLHGLHRRGCAGQGSVHILFQIAEGFRAFFHAGDLRVRAEALDPQPQTAGAGTQIQHTGRFYARKGLRGGLGHHLGVGAGAEHPRPHDQFKVQKAPVTAQVLQRLPRLPAQAEGLQPGSLRFGQGRVRQPDIPPGHQPEKFCGVVIRIRASGRRQTGFQLPHRVPRGHTCRYHLPSSGFSGSTGVTAAMATSIMLSSGSNTVRCCTQMPG